MSESDERSPAELLHSALSSAFTPVSIAPAPPSSPPTVPPAAAENAPEPLVTQETLAAHERERLALEQSWKEESAVQRREAEERRARFAAARAASGAGENESDDIAGPPNPLFGKEGNTGYPGEPKVVDGRDVVTGEPSATRHAEASAQLPSPTTTSQRWEEIESLESSYPSLSFPEHSPSNSAPSSEHTPASKSASKSAKPHDQSEKPSGSTGGAGAVERLPSTTLSIFDTRLSTRTRFIALLSSLSINLFLPFVNGVMLGFGEIFARNMASRLFGWGVPTSAPGPGGAATAVGVRAAVIGPGTGKDPERRIR